MKYHSTRGDSEPVDFTTAMVQGLAPDGGLYIPGHFPSLPSGWESWSYEQALSKTLHLYGAADTDRLVKEAAALFHHPEVAPIVAVGDR